MKIAIHQPQYIPWIPYFSKICQSEIFVFFDDVQFQKNGLQNRNFILSKNGQIRLTIPVTFKFGDKINTVKIAKRSALLDHWRTIELAYGRAAHFKQIAEILKKIYYADFTLLSEFSIEIIRTILDYLSIKTVILESSNINKQGAKSDSVLSICRNLKADVYLTGSGGLEYLKQDDFEREGVKVESLKYNFRPYRQFNNRSNFIDKLSILDLLFNTGREAVKYL